MLNDPEYPAINPPSLLSILQKHIADTNCLRCKHVINRGDSKIYLSYLCNAAREILYQNVFLGGND